MQRRYQALGRMKTGKMNKTEMLYRDRLELLKKAGEILDYWFECIKLRIGETCFLDADFFVLTKDMHLELHEVKGGFITDDALVKLKAVADKYPFPVRMMQYKNKQWAERTF